MSGDYGNQQYTTYLPEPSNMNILATLSFTSPGQVLLEGGSSTGAGGDISAVLLA